MAESINPATTGGARIVAKAGKLATPSIAQTAADCDLNLDVSDGARFMRSPAETSITTDGRYGLEDDPAGVNMEIAGPTVNASSRAAGDLWREAVETGAALANVLCPMRFELIGHDAAAFEHGGERVVIRRERGDPLFAAARAALARGVDPARPVTVFRDGRTALIVRGSLAALARLDVREDGRGLRLVRWRPFAGGRADD